MSLDAQFVNFTPKFPRIRADGVYYALLLVSIMFRLSPRKLLVKHFLSSKISLFKVGVEFLRQPSCSCLFRLST